MQNLIDFSESCRSNHKTLGGVGMQKNVRVGFISDVDLADRRGWSGTIHTLAEAIAKEHAIVPIVIGHTFVEKVMKGIDFLFSLGKRREGFFLRQYNAHRLKRKLRQVDCDVYFAPAQSRLIALGVPQNKKLIYLSDAVFRLMVGYYWFDMNPRLEKYLDSCEALSLSHSDIIILSSEWAKKGAIKFYGTPEEKIYVLPFGANLGDDYAGRIFPAKYKEIKLLLVGVDWERKGVDIAIDCVAELNRLEPAIRFDLTIVGFERPEGRSFADSVHFAGRLNKNIPEEYDRLISHYQNSDMFLLPTKAECSAIVFAEAAEYGLPVFTHRTGGVESYVEDGVTGRCLELGATGKDFAEAILDVITSNSMERFSKAARKKYVEELNWESWRKSFERILSSM